MNYSSTLKAKSQSGFSLMNAMLGMAAMSVLGVAVVTMIGDGIRGSKAVEMNNEISELESELVGVLAVPASCQNIFGGNSSTNSTYATITDPVTGQDYPTGAASRYGDTQYSVQPYRISNAGLGNTGTLNGGGTGITNLVITINRNDSAVTQKRVVGPDTVVKNIRLRVTTAPGGNIVTCHATAQLDDVIWARNPADPTQIFYMDEVTIGTDTNPSPDQLYVLGGIQAAGAGGNVTAAGDLIAGDDLEVADVGRMRRIEASNGGTFGASIAVTGDVSATGNVEASGDVSGQNLISLDDLNVADVGRMRRLQTSNGASHGGSIAVTGDVSATGNGEYSGFVRGNYLHAGSGGSCLAGSEGVIKGGGRIQFCESRPVYGTRFFGYKVADGDPVCVQTAHSVSPQCGTGNYARGLTDCRLVGGTGPGVECRVTCCDDGSAGY